MKHIAYSDYPVVQRKMVMVKETNDGMRELLAKRALAESTLEKDDATKSCLSNEMNLPMRAETPMYDSRNLLEWVSGGKNKLKRGCAAHPKSSNVNFSL